jgi:2-haloacid dehalogenase
MSTESPARALVFDVFGTLVDWRGSIIAAGRRIGDPKAVVVDWGALADDWRREGYLAPIRDLMAGEVPWQEVETFLAPKLVELLDRAGVREFDAADTAELGRVWEELNPWPDTVPGLERLRQSYVLAPLSNGSFATLTRMAKRASMPWDCIISSALFRSFKPDPAVYLGAASLLGLPPEDVMLVAAHAADLRAAAACGMRTAYVPRPMEWGPGTPVPESDGQDFDVVAADMIDLAEQLSPA